jgi:hypothetical protein
LEQLGADEELLAVIGSWGDTLDDASVLAMLKEWNTTGRCCTGRNEAAATALSAHPPEDGLGLTAVRLAADDHAIGCQQAFLSDPC